MNIQDWFPLEWTSWISLQSKGLSSLLQHRSSKASVLQRSTFFVVQLLHPDMTTGKTIALTRWTFVGKVMSLLFNMPTRFVIAFLPRSKPGPDAIILVFWMLSFKPTFSLMLYISKDLFTTVCFTQCVMSDCQGKKILQDTLKGRRHSWKRQSKHEN